ncbi:MAG: hypothetical protein HRU23_00500 [Gammaproteobacteria bacterium]|nr:hypothetical protein [Gammaproteobacteria bacterium]
MKTILYVISLSAALTGCYTTEIIKPRDNQVVGAVECKVCSKEIGETYQAIDLSTLKSTITNANSNDLIYRDNGVTNVPDTQRLETGEKNILLEINVLDRYSIEIDSTKSVLTE